MNLIHIKVKMDCRQASKNKVQQQLSSKELLAVSKEISLLFSPSNPNSKAISNVTLEMSALELLEVSQNISLYYPPKILSQSKKLVVLPIDPEHIYVYWDVTDKQDARLSQKLANNEIKLRLSSQLNTTENRQPVVEITINTVQAQQRIELPSVKNTAVFSAVVGAFSKETDFVPFLSSESSHSISANSQHNAVDKSGQSDASTLFVSTIPVKSAYPQTNHSAKGKTHYS